MRRRKIAERTASDGRLSIVGALSLGAQERELAHWEGEFRRPRPSMTPGGSLGEPTWTEVAGHGVTTVGSSDSIPRALMLRCSRRRGEKENMSMINRRRLPRLMISILCLTSMHAVAAEEPQLVRTKAEQELDAEVARQMKILDDFEASYTAIEKKLADALVIQLRRARKDPSLVALKEALPQYHLPEVELEPDGRVRVEIMAAAKSDDPVAATKGIVEAIEFLGGSIESVGMWVRPIVNAQVPLEAIPKLAEREDVSGIGIPLALIHGQDRPPKDPGTRGGKQPAEIQPRPKAVRPVPAVINRSQGDVAHQANVVRSLGTTGAGIAVCVLSDGVNSLAAVQATGDLPAVTVLPGFAGSGDEGTAMLEIVYDLAPGASLAFATAGSNATTAAAGINALGNHGCNIIASDISIYPPAGAFFPSPYEQAIESWSQQGVFVFINAGNLGKLGAATSGVWEGDYNPQVIPSGNWHNWGGGDIQNTIQSDAASYALIWSDAVGNVVSDFDLRMFDNGVLVGSGASVNPSFPVELLTSAADDTGRQLWVRKNPGTFLRYIRLQAGNNSGGGLGYRTEGAVVGELGAEGAIAVAAVDVATAGGGAFVGGASNPTSDYSSDGPRRMFYDTSGNPIGTPLASGGRVVEKPDFAAASNVTTAAPGFNPFPGTSAAVPHAAAIAALVLEGRSGVDLAELRSILALGSLDIDGPGRDRNSGHGVLRADLSVRAVFADGFETGDASRWLVFP